MVKSFSRLGLLKNKFQEETQSFWQIIKEPSNKYIEIEIPYYDYLRGNVLISDMKRVMDDCPSIDLAKLIYLLYLQFLYQVRKGVTTVKNKKQGFDLNTLGYKLISLRNDCVAPKLVEKVRVEDFNQITPTTWVLEEREEEVEKPTRGKPKYAYLTIRMKTEEIYRGEILLNDLNHINEEVNFGVEELMAILYIDFINKIKQEGNDEKVMKSIIASYEYFKYA
ncbi:MULTISPECIES: hypothetical protein [Cytobacillus]|uniref:Uncharacterized protein n=1 Tax=Cytobacillus oceanisediminis TaxID=665099 RepID=A0ABX3CMZ6_9BACI|nr:hypothetical protein [Cytobacillus oceanisediminis]EFV75004.1 hypothetical protein HMPREF1013_04777 [Bacillus sp. 2_A_57_CT2]MCM3402930.1 hypothetical protein [Cytobacillus oceanisediminis]OHX45042.1 hypothetical protein BBV17_24265 [Cytobacillus oceanisediminis]